MIVLLLFAGPTALAQGTVRVIDNDSSQDVIIELSASALSPSANFLAVRDSGNHELALSSLAIDDENVWIKNSKEDSQIENATHWYFDEPSKTLFLDLRGIRSMLTPQRTVRFTILPLKTFENRLSLSVLETSADSGDLSDALQKISDLNVGLK